MELADIFRAAGPAYEQAFARHLLPSHLRALRDIALCRTHALGGSLYACDDCGTLDFAYHSCRNRHCPKCQHDRAQSWLERLRARLLPCDHYLLTFTLPDALRATARAHQRLVYAMLLREAAATVQNLAGDTTWIGGRPAILAVLHTWSRTLAYHPHAHLLVSAGGLSPDGSAWIKPAHPRFLMPGYVLSHLFRTQIRSAFETAELLPTVPAHVWKKPWVVHVQQIGTGENAALYLSRYIFRVALTNDRIERFENGHVTFRYTDSHTHQSRRMRLAVQDFIARFLQHVLPRGFAKVRYYGLLSPTSHEDLERARHLLTSAAHHLAPAAVAAPTSATPAAPATPPRTPQPCATTSPPSPRRCPVCQRGQLLRVAEIHAPRAPP